MFVVGTEYGCAAELCSAARLFFCLASVHKGNRQEEESVHEETRTQTSGPAACNGPAAGLLPGAALAEEDPDGHIVMSFELYSPEDNMVVLLTGPQKVSFQSDDTGLSLAQDLLGAENVDVASGWITSFTIDGYEYTAAEMGDYGSWSIYKNNAEDGVTIDQYVPADGDVYRVILTSYDPTTYKFPVMPHDLDALYWAMAEYSGELSDEANALVQGEGVTQDQIDAMTAQLCPDSASYRVLIDNRTVQVDTSRLSLYLHSHLVCRQIHRGSR